MQEKIIAAYLFIKNYIEEIVGVSTGTSFYIMVSPYHIIFNWDALWTMLFNWFSVGMSAAISWGVVKFLKWAFEKPETKKAKKK